MSLDPFGLLSSFDEEWFVSRQAGVIFFLSAVSSIAVMALLVGLVHPSGMSPAAKFPWIVFSVAGPAGLLVLYFGMWWYWIRFDDSGAWAKRLWFLILLVGPWFGGILYCFFVYLPQVYRKENTVR